MSRTTTLALVDDDDAFRSVMAGELERAGYEVLAFGSGRAAIEGIAEAAPPVMLLDLRLPDMSGLDVLKAVRDRSPSTDVIMLTGHGSIDSAIEAVRMGAYDYLSKPCPLDEVIVRIDRALERQSLKTRATLVDRALAPPDVSGFFLGDSPEFGEVRQLIERVAPTNSSVLITGETGSGKEMAAKLIHARSQRRGKPFVVVECAALQESLLQSELFGHVKGAFTGADRAKAGLFEVANGGTIFLDEIGEISPATQVKLLRVLDTSTFRRVGGTDEIHVDARVIAATNRDLPALIAQGLFREDIYYRLRTITVRLPPLRERRGDVALLAQHFVDIFNERFAFRKRLGPEALERLREHRWPGNVRELLHAIEAAVIVCPGDELRPEHFATLRGAPSPAAAIHPAASPLPAGDPEALDTLETVERRHIEHVLRVTKGHRSQAARVLGVSERNLYRKLREYGLAFE
jgi:DNA-binding NtrC family response regulator